MDPRPAERSRTEMAAGTTLGPHEAAGPELRKQGSEDVRAGRAIANFEDEPADLRFLTTVPPFHP